ncbi:MAG: ComEC/Rec2 family competence protein, partial [Saccharospirillaceae bacterium]|nr:ComEC/Rec2 family competence protein [Saccharospirillaceae bacterium]
MLSLLSTLVYLIISVFVFYYSEISYLEGLSLWAFLCLLQSVVIFKFLHTRWQYNVVSFVLVTLTWSHLFYGLNKRIIAISPIEVNATIHLVTSVKTYDYQKVSTALIDYELEGKRYRKKVKIAAPLEMHFPQYCEFKGNIKLLRLRSSNNRFIYDGAKWSFINGIQGKAKLLQVFSTCAIIKASLRERIKNRIIAMPKLKKNSKAMLIALLFGDQTLLSDRTKSLFVNTQTIHLMVVSGLHIGVCA